jgi:hypothetical protein
MTTVSSWSANVPGSREDRSGSADIARSQGNVVERSEPCQACRARKVGRQTLLLLMYRTQEQDAGYYQSIAALLDSRDCGLSFSRSNVIGEPEAAKTARGLSSSVPIVQSLGLRVMRGIRLLRANCLRARTLLTNIL